MSLFPHRSSILHIRQLTPTATRRTRPGHISTTKRTDGNQSQYAHKTLTITLPSVNQQPSRTTQRTTVRNIKHHHVATTHIPLPLLTHDFQPFAWPLDRPTPLKNPVPWRPDAFGYKLTLNPSDSPMFKATMKPRLLGPKASKKLQNQLHDLAQEITKAEITSENNHEHQWEWHWLDVEEERDIRENQSAEERFDQEAENVADWVFPSISMSLERRMGRVPPLWNSRACKEQRSVTRRS